MKLLDRALPFTVGPYIFLEKLGQGGMGQVFLVRESLSNGETRFQVVKTLREDRYDDEHRRRFFDEVRVVVQLLHPNICRVRSAGELENTPFLSMDHVAGVDLKVLFAAMQGTPVSTDIATLIASEMLAALHHAHTAVDDNGKPLNIVHRDVSPNNVLVSFEGRATLIDFGLALSEQKSERTAHGVVLGKPGYMSPEQALGMSIDPRADLYSTGVAFTELITGERFYGERKGADLFHDISTDNVIVDLERVPASHRKFVGRATARRPRDRFGSAQEMLRALKKIARVDEARVRAQLVELMNARLGDTRAGIEGRLAAYKALPGGSAAEAGARENTETFRIRLSSTISGESEQGTQVVTVVEPIALELGSEEHTAAHGNIFATTEESSTHYLERTSKASSVAAPVVQQAPRRRAPVLLLGVLFGLLLLGGAAFFGRDLLRPPTTPDAGPVIITQAPPDAEPPDDTPPDDTPPDKSPDAGPARDVRDAGVKTPEPQGGDRRRTRRRTRRVPKRPPLTVAIPGKDASVAARFFFLRDHCRSRTRCAKRFSFDGVRAKKDDPAFSAEINRCIARCR